MEEWVDSSSKWEMLVFRQDEQIRRKRKSSESVYDGRRGIALLGEMEGF